MGTRSGDVDPALHAHLHRQLGWSIDEIDAALNRDVGAQGPRRPQRLPRGPVAPGGRRRGRGAGLRRLRLPDPQVRRRLLRRPRRPCTASSSPAASASTARTLRSAVAVRAWSASASTLDPARNEQQRARAPRRVARRHRRSRPRRAHQRGGRDRRRPWSWRLAVVRGVRRARLTAVESRVSSWHSRRINLQARLDDCTRDSTNARRDSTSGPQAARDAGVEGGRHGEVCLDVDEVHAVGVEEDGVDDEVVEVGYVERELADGDHEVLERRRVDGPGAAGCRRARARAAGRARPGRHRREGPAAGAAPRRPRSRAWCPLRRRRAPAARGAGRARARRRPGDPSAGAARERRRRPPSGVAEAGDRLLDLVGATQVDAHAVRGRPCAARWSRPA